MRCILGVSSHICFVTPSLLEIHYALYIVVIYMRRDMPKKMPANPGKKGTKLPAKPRKKVRGEQDNTEEGDVHVPRNTGRYTSVPRACPQEQMSQVSEEQRTTSKRRHNFEVRGTELGIWLVAEDVV